MPEKVLLIQPKQIGDVLMTTPAVRELYRKIPNGEIHFLTQPPSDQIFAYNPYISKVIKIPGKPGFGEIISILRQLRKEHYTTIVDFQGMPNTAVISRLIGARKRIGFNKKGRSLFYTHPVDTPKHLHYSALQKMNLLSSLGVNSKDAKLDFFITEKERAKAKQILSRIGVSDNRPLVSVSPVSRRDYKVWPAEYFAQVCDYLADKYAAQILFLWGPGEFHFVKKVKDKMKRSALPKYDIPTISETVALLELVDLHLGNDNGPMHFAIAAGTQTVAIFGRPLMKNWTPPDNPRHLAVEYDPGCKNSCVYPECGLECLKELTPEMVMKTIDQHLG